MLEKVKQVLIDQKKAELNKKKQLEQELDRINEEEKQNTFIDVDEKLKQLEQEIDDINSTLIGKIINGKKVKELYQQYKEISKNKISKLAFYKNKRDELLNQLYIFTHNEDVLIEQEIIRINKAKTLEDLGLTEEKARELLTTCNLKEPTIIQKVFYKVVMSTPSTSEDIFRIMQNLYQTNSSAFAVAMRNTKILDIIDQLAEMNIIIDEEKQVFLKQLNAYIKSSDNKLPSTKLIDKTDRLDNYYCNEIEKAITSIEKNSNPESTIIAQIITLTALVSIAKVNKKENESRK